MIAPVSQAAPSYSAGAVGLSGDNEKVERVPDNEAAEIAVKAKAPLPEYLGVSVDMEA